MKKLLLLVLAAAILLVLGALAVVVYGFREQLAPADIAVVLGNEVYVDATVSPRLAGRLDRAVDLYEQGLVRQVIVSGGVGRSGVDEATAMKDYLLLQGLPGDVIVVDSNGANTRATAEFTRDYMRAHKLSSVIAVSQFFHLPRTVMTLRSYGIEPVGAAHSRHYEWRDVFSTFREVPAIVFYTLGLR